MATDKMEIEQDIVTPLLLWYESHFICQIIIFFLKDEQPCRKSRGVGSAINHEASRQGTRAVGTIFCADSERIFQEKGLEAFTENEKLNAKNPLAEGPFARFLKILSSIQGEFPADKAPIRTASIFAAVSHILVIPETRPVRNRFYMSNYCRFVQPLLPRGALPPMRGWYGLCGLGMCGLMKRFSLEGSVKDPVLFPFCPSP